MPTTPGQGLLVTCLNAVLIRLIIAYFLRANDIWLSQSNLVKGVHKIFLRLLIPRNIKVKG